MSSASKKHDPTEKKLKRAREEGTVAKSQTFTQLFQIVGIIVGLAITIQLFWSRSEILLHYRGSWDIQGIGEWGVFWQRLVCKSALVTLGCGLLGTVLGEITQVGLRLSLKPICFRLDRLSPSSAFSKLGKDLKASWLLFVKFLGAALVTIFFINLHMKSFPAWWLLPREELSQKMQFGLFYFGLAVAVLWFCLGVMERLYRKYEFINEQRMTDEELRREMRESEGDPTFRSHRRALHRELSSQELGERVRRSRVVVVKRRKRST